MSHTDARVNEGLGVAHSKNVVMKKEMKCCTDKFVIKHEFRGGELFDDKFVIKRLY